VATQLQPSLFAPRRLSHAERFERFHQQNPEVYRMICRYARRAKERGHTRYSLKTIWCVMRFEEHMRVERAGERKLTDALAKEV
jgi:hypothetical protein